jgi:hypothetical protein
MTCNFYANGHNIEIELENYKKFPFSHLDIPILRYSVNECIINDETPDEELEEIDNLDFHIDFKNRKVFYKLMKTKWNSYKLPRFISKRDEDDIVEWYEKLKDKYDDEDFRIACLIYQISVSFDTTEITGDFDC